MKFYIQVINDTKVLVRGRVEDQGMIGDFHQEVSKGESLFGVQFDELLDKGNKNGIIEIEGSEV